MVNDLKLQEGHPVDENLRPIKVGGKSTALETAQHGNGAKVNGDFTVTGKINGKTDIQLDDDITCDDITCDDITCNTITSTDLTIDDSGDITLDADGGEVYLKDGGDTFAQFSTSGTLPSLKLFESPGGTDYCSIVVVPNGSAVISTYDAAGSDAHLSFSIDGNITLDSAGDITLDSNTGVFILKNAGTQFSVANSSYAGMILGYTTVGIDAADDAKTATTSMAVTDSAHKVNFIAPPSEVVEIFVSIYADFSRRNLTFGLSDSDTYSPIDFPGADDATNEHVVAYPPSSLGDRTINHRWVVTGLTPGTQYEWWLGFKSTHALANVVRWGGNVSGEYAPFIMKATALPAAVTDFAVYG